jgi:hypothetical protein
MDAKTRATIEDLYRAEGKESAKSWGELRPQRAIQTTR